MPFERVDASSYTGRTIAALAGMTMTGRTYTAASAALRYLDDPSCAIISFSEASSRAAAQLTADCEAEGRKINIDISSISCVLRTDFAPWSIDDPLENANKAIRAENKRRAGNAIGTFLADLEAAFLEYQVVVIDLLDTPVNLYRVREWGESRPPYVTKDGVTKLGKDGSPVRDRKQYGVPNSAILNDVYNRVRGQASLPQDQSSDVIYLLKADHKRINNGQEEDKTAIPEPSWPKNLSYAVDYGIILYAPNYEDPSQVSFRVLKPGPYFQRMGAIAPRMMWCEMMDFVTSG